MNRYPVEVVLRITVEATTPKEAVARANDAVTIRPVDDDVEVAAITIEVSPREISWAPTPEDEAAKAEILELQRRMVEALERVHPKKKEWEPGDDAEGR